MQTLIRWDRFIGNHLPLAVLIAVILGLSFPNLFVPINRFAIPLFAFITFANSLGGGFRELGHVILHPLPVLAALLLLHVMLPLIAMGTGKLFLPNHPLFTTGLILEYTIPTGVASLMWVGISHGNAILCLSIVLLDTILSPLVIPLTLKLLVGSVVEMDTMGMMRDMMLMVAIPALIGMTLFQRTKGRVAVTLKPRLAFFAKIILLLIIGGNASGCEAFLHDIDRTLLLVMLLTFLLCAGGFFAGYWTGKLLRLDYPTTETLCLNTGLRNISAGSVLAMEYFPPDVLFPVAFTPLFLQLFASLVVKVLQTTPSGKKYLAEKDISYLP